ncbi:MAG: protein kinase [Ignavibacterium sp.]|nr:protein kinase [Ignavibacterium sp.]
MINQRYILKKKLGEGRSKVYSAIDSEFPEKEIAMKILPPNIIHEEKNSFEKEYFILRKLDHPNIIKAYDIGVVLTIDNEDQDEIETGSSFITIEKFDSVEFNKYAEINNESTLINIIKQICSALFYLHQSNYIYYDLKPQNILVSGDSSNPQIKIIDLGLAHYILSDTEINIRGTAEYIAPEVLKRQSHDHSVDLYSLGIILYSSVYGKLPFEFKSELDIYKAHIEKEFDFAASDYSPKLIGVIKKLLTKDADHRYSTALQVLADLDVELNIELTKDFIPAKTLCGRKDTLTIVKTYLNDESSNEIFSIRGFSGAGKSQVLRELNAIYPQSVYVENTRKKTGADLLRFFFHKLFFNDHLYDNLLPEDREVVKQIFDSREVELSDFIKALISRITDKKKLLLLIDDYNLYDDFAKDAINEILPILQINKVKVVLAESSEFDYATDNLFNIQSIQITPFTDRQLSEYLDLSYYQNFPKQKLRKVILEYADLLPGSVVQFIKDILILGVMRYEPDEVKFVFEKGIEKSLSGSNEEVYRLRLSNLTEDELKVAQLISAFNISVEQIVLASILNKSPEQIEKILLNLHYKNIINPLSISNSPNIISDSFKGFIYNTIKEKKKYHLIIASLIKRILPDFNVIEHARQYELAGEFIKVVELINKEIKRAEDISVYSYKRKLIQGLLRLPVNKDIKNSLLDELIKTLYKLSDFKEVLECFEKIDNSAIDENIRKELLFIQGSSLISVRRITEGIEVLNILLENENEASFRQKILTEIAYAEFELGNYKVSEKIALDLLNQKETSDEEKGKCYNLLGMIKVYAEEDLNSALERFNNALVLYKKAQSPRRVSGVEVNLGNIYNMLGDDEKSEMHWGNALKINESIGNLEQEAAILINYGVYYLNKLQLERSQNLLIRSDKIFSAIGNKTNQGLVLINLGELYLVNCDYQKSFEALTQAEKIFYHLKKYEELADVLFDFSRLHYELNNYPLFEENLTKHDRLITDQNLTGKYLINQNILNFLKQMSNDETINKKSLDLILNELFVIGEKRNFCEFFILVTNYLIRKKDIDNNYLIELLFKENFVEEMNQNFLTRAYYEYFLGKIALRTTDKRLSPPIDHLERSFSLIENQTITELTWRVLAAISDSYIERGFLNKAKKPLIYASELLNYIADKIKKSDFRSKYLDDIERKKVFNNLKLLNTPMAAQ